MSKTRGVEPGSLAPIPRVALTREEAAAALGVGLETFRTKVQPELQMIRRGSVRIVAVTELQRWIDENAERVLE